MIVEKLLYAATFATEAIIAWLYFSYIYRQTRSNLFTFLSFVLGYSFLFIIFQFASVILNGVFLFVVNTIILFLNYSCKFRSSVLHSSFLALVMAASEILVNICIMRVTGDYSAYTYSFSALMSLSVFSKLLYFFITVIAARLFKPHKGFPNEPSLIVLLCVMPLVSVIVIVTFFYIGSICPLTNLTEILVAVSSMTLLLVNIVVLFIYNRIQKLDEEHAAFQMSRLRDEADAEYYEMLQQQYDGQQILIHDIKKHLNMIDLMAEGGDNQKIREYISELEDTPEFQHKARLCDNPILNMILLRNAELCSENNISFSCDVRAGSVSFMDDTSITALFGNLLSNAVEAAQKSEARMVELSVIKNTEKNLVHISAVNSCDAAPVRDARGNFESTKDTITGHGYGIKSIRRVVAKYNGLSDMRYDTAEKEFHSVIAFLLPANYVSTPSLSNLPDSLKTMPGCD